MCAEHLATRADLVEAEGASLAHELFIDLHRAEMQAA
jgi:hypothetical protein